MVQLLPFLTKSIKMKAYLFTLIFTCITSLQLGVPVVLDWNSLSIDNRIYQGELGIEIVVASKKIKRSEYAEKHAAAAIQEMKEFGIPASIKLAQGILESSHGRSYLSRVGNNHFGIKCFNGCNDSNSINLKDDTPKDRFRLFDSVWDSFRGHSLFLAKNKRYKKLFDLQPTDFRGWAKGLQGAKYATDPLYSSKLINIIETYGLDRYDRAQ
jgi:flagellum-specific peptidoglycan hydrolase FlgJ